MRILRPLQPLLRRSWRQRLVLMDALASLAIASIVIKLLPFGRAVRWGAYPINAPHDGDQTKLIGELRSGVEAAARRVPWRTVCFQQGVALQSMLRRRGIDARLHYGVRYEPSKKLEGHVWVVAGDAMIIGGELAPDFKTVAVFPPRIAQ